MISSDPGGITYVPDQDLYHKRLEPPKALVNLELLAQDITQDKLGRIAELLQKLTYGQMVALGTEIFLVGGDGGFSPTSLPSIIWKWSLTHGKNI